MSLVAGIEDEWLRDHWVRIAMLNGLRVPNDLSRLEREAVDWPLPGTYIERLPSEHWASLGETER